MRRLVLALTSTGAICSNGNAAGVGGFFNGVIDEARVWNYARSAEQILSGMARDVPTASGLLGRWSLDELTQSTNTFTVSNTGSAGLTGTVIGASATAGWSLVPGSDVHYASSERCSGRDRGDGPGDHPPCLSIAARISHH